MTLSLLRYNNYYNRIIKRRATLGEYEENGEVLITFDNIAFNPNDGISTEQIINYDGPIPDYVILSEDGYAATSRWFVIEAVRTRAGQYQLSLYRDVIADWWDEVVAAPTFVEKAMLDTGNDLIFNNENMTFNQIKTSETLLKDNSGTAWYAAYISKDVGQIELTVPSIEITPDIEVSSLDQYDFYKYQTEDYHGDYIGPVLCSIDVRDVYDAAGANTYRFSVNLRNNSPTTSLDGRPNLAYYGDALPTGACLLGERNNFGNDYEWKYIRGEETTAMKEIQELNTGWQSIVSTLNANSLILQNSYTYTKNNKGTPILQEDGKIIYDATAGKYYQVKVIKKSRNRFVKRIPSGSAMDNTLGQPAEEYLQITSPLGNPFSIDATFDAYRVAINEYTLGQLQLTIPGSRRHCQDTPYDILMFPYNNEHIWNSEQGGRLTINKLNTARLVNQLMLKLANSGAEGASELYDIQLVPYCPILEEYMVMYDSGTTDIGGWIDTDNYEANKDYVLHDNLFVFMPSSSSFTKILKQAAVAEVGHVIDYSISVPDNPIDFKVANECDKYRLCSPNYNGTFEFSATKNRGVSGYNITCSYKPYTPYIKVSPIFDGLYGDDFQDARGLICGGDFSISQITDAFTNYELNNKNYQVMFDRQIQNMEVNNAVQREMEMWQAIAGTVGGATTGAMAGMMTPMGGKGAAVGLATGAISAAAGLRDMALNEQLRNEAIDFTKDQFGYQLGNIKALPYSLTKVSARNADNKLFPFVEYYTATEREKQALRSKITYNGMTVMAIDNIANYLRETPSYIKGKVIRLEGIEDDFHVVNTIAKEINNGVYI